MDTRRHSRGTIGTRCGARAAFVRQVRDSVSRRRMRPQSTYPPRGTPAPVVVCAHMAACEMCNNEVHAPNPNAVNCYLSSYSKHKSLTPRARRPTLTRIYRLYRTQQTSTVQKSRSREPDRFVDSQNDPAPPSKEARHTRSCSAAHSSGLLLCERLPATHACGLAVVAIPRQAAPRRTGAATLRM